MARGGWAVRLEQTFIDRAPEGVGLLLMAPRGLGPHSDSDSDSLCRGNRIVPRRLPTEASLPVPTCPQ